MQTSQFQKIYLDTCCLSCLFNPQTQTRIRRETEAIDRILLHVDTGRWYWIASGVLRFEIIQNPDLEQRANLENILRSAHQVVLVGRQK